MTSNPLCDQITKMHGLIRDLEIRYGRESGSVQLLAVSKMQPVERIQEAIACGQTDFGENYVQELLAKARIIGREVAQWHFIGPLQSNKTRTVSETVNWVHTIDRIKIAQRLNDQRPMELPALNVCLQVNLDDESSKSGIQLDELPKLAMQVSELQRLRLRGLMTIPAPGKDFAAQRQGFARLRQALEQLNTQGYTLDTLSMGMSDDFEAAIAEGATIIRIGTRLFGARPKPQVE
jgi:pyridoxal phosphate enzyme (YggS family)